MGCFVLRRVHSEYCSSGRVPKQGVNVLVFLGIDIRVFHYLQIGIKFVGLVPKHSAPCGHVFGLSVLATDVGGLAFSKMLSPRAQFTPSYVNCDIL